VFALKQHGRRQFIPIKTLVMIEHGAPIITAGLPVALRKIAF